METIEADRITSVRSDLRPVENDGEEGMKVDGGGRTKKDSRMQTKAERTGSREIEER